MQANRIALAIDPLQNGYELREPRLQDPLRDCRERCFTSQPHLPRRILQRYSNKSGSCYAQPAVRILRCSARVSGEFYLCLFSARELLHAPEAESPSWRQPVLSPGISHRAQEFFCLLFGLWTVRWPEDRTRSCARRATFTQSPIPSISYPPAPLCCRPSESRQARGV
jgi:hypothetical protein